MKVGKNALQLAENSRRVDELELEKCIIFWITLQLLGLHLKATLGTA